MYFVVDCRSDETATLKDLARLAKRIQNYSGEFASVLDPDLFFEKYETIKLKHPSSPFLQATTILHEWRSRHADKAYRRLLIQALIAMEKRLEANEVFGEEVVRQVSPQHLE